MYRNLLLILLTLMPCSLLALELTEAEQEFLDQHPVITLGYSLDFPPLLMRSDEGTLEGILVDSFAEVEKRLGIEFRYQIGEWRPSIEAAARQQVDLIPMMNAGVAARHKLLTVKYPYANLVSVFTRDDFEKNLASLSELKGKRLGYPKNIIFLDRFLQKNYPSIIDLFPVADNETLYKMLSDGEIDAVINFNNTQYVINHLGLKNIQQRFTTPEIQDSDVSSAIRADFKPFQSILEKAFASIPTAVIDNIWQKWIKAPSPYDLSNTEIAYLKKHPVINVCAKPEYYPFIKVDGDNIYGAIGELFKIMQTRLEVKFRAIEVTDYADLNNKILAGECDILAPIERSQTQYPNYLASLPFREVKLAMAGNIDNLFIENPQTLNQVSIVTRYEELGKLLQKEYPGIRYQLVPDLKTALDKILVDESTHIVNDQLILSHMIEQTGFDKIKLTGIFEKAIGQMAFGIDQKKPELLQILNKSIAGFSQPELNNIFYEFRPTRTIVTQNIYLLYVILFALLVIGLLTYRNRLINSKNKQIRSLNKSLQVNREELIVSNHELAESNQELRTFAYSVSHDLSSPLRSINGYSTLLLKKYQDELDDTAVHYLQRMITSSIQMQDNIDAILQLSRLTRHELEIKRFDAYPVLSEIVKKTAAQYQNDNYTADIDENLMVTADPALFKTLMKNLIGNAFKYAADDRPLTLKFATTHINGKPYYFLKDNGIGFEMQYHDKIFQPFQRLHTQEKIKGTGIGLSIVNRIIKRHNGVIFAKSEPDQGATFFFSL